MVTEVGGRDPARLVIYLHEAGLDMRAARFLPVVRTLAECGAWVVLPELPLHGRRSGDVRYDPDIHRLEVVDKVAYEVSTLLDTVDASECTVVGGSLGGLCAMAAAVRDRRVRRVGSFLAPFFWSPMWTGYDVVAHRDPGRNISSLLDRDILMVFGGDDGWTAGLDLPAMSGRFETVVLDGHGHQQSDELAATLASWYSKSLTEGVCEA
jgi:pimeloyl-ACP methyl ester carboxylesterase